MSSAGPLVNTMAKTLGIEWFDYQLAAFEMADAQLLSDENERMLLFFKTGAGKSYTALMCMRLMGVDDVLVITPPSTYAQWMEAGKKFEIDVECMSHAKFRMKSTKLSRHKAMIVDEFHLLGGHTGQGWKKMDTLARHLQSPLIIASATPNYNDAERVYCIQHVLAPDTCKGGYLEFLYTNCITRQNPFSMTPDVEKFIHFDEAKDYLASLPYVAYLEDDLVYTIAEKRLLKKIPQTLERFGVHPRKKKMIASQIEERHAVVDFTFIDRNGYLRPRVEEILGACIPVEAPLLVYADHSTVAEAAFKTLDELFSWKAAIITGKTSTKAKEQILSDFKAGKFQILVGTASLATGTDGLDKMCDQLLILDDTQDDSLRRQLIGRIMPRGADTDTSKKRVTRINLVD